jgi:hypothetical protein
VKKLILSLLFLVGLAVGAGLEASVPGEKPIQFSLAFSGTAFWDEYENPYVSKGPYTIIGATGRVDFNLWRWLIFAPELTLGFGGGMLGGTLNIRHRGFFAGAGIVALTFWSADDESGIGLIWKFQAGIKGRSWIATAAYFTADPAESLAGRGAYGLQLSIGHIY